MLHQTTNIKINKYRKHVFSLGAEKYTVETCIFQTAFSDLPSSADLRTCI